MDRGQPGSASSVFGVLTGDLKKSAAMPDAKLAAARAAIGQAVRDFRTDIADAVIGEPAFFRGDGWQVLLADPRWALRLALLIRGQLRAGPNARTRTGIGLGRAEKVNAGNVLLSSGEAFTLSGRLLDAMGREHDLALALPEAAHEARLWPQVVVHLCDAFARDWSQRQAEVVCLMLRQQKASQVRVVEALNPRVTKQTVQRILKAAHWHAVEEAIGLFERTDWLAELGLAAHRPKSQTHTADANKSA